MEEAQLVQLPEPDFVVPEALRITDAGDMRLSPNDMRELKAATGRKLTELTGADADEADAMQTMAWLHLRRSGNPVPWELLGDVAIEFEPGTPDPTSDEHSTSLQASAASGDSPPERSIS